MLVVFVVYLVNKFEGFGSELVTSFEITRGKGEQKLAGGFFFGEGSFLLEFR